MSAKAKLDTKAELRTALHILMVSDIVELIAEYALPAPVLGIVSYHWPCRQLTGPQKGLPATMGGICIAENLTSEGEPIADSPYIYVAAGHCLFTFTKRGKLIGNWGSYGFSDGQFQHPRGMVCYQGCLYVCDQRNHRVQVLNANTGEYITEWRPERMHFNCPTSIAVDRDGLFYVTDTRNHRILVVSPEQVDLPDVRIIGEDDPKTSLDLLRDLISSVESSLPALPIVVPEEAPGDSMGHMVGTMVIQYIRKARLQQQAQRQNAKKNYRHKSSGRVVRSWGTRGTGDGELMLPYSIAVEGDFVFVSDDLYRVQVFTRTGRFVRRWGKEGTQPGEFQSHINLTSASGVIYACDTIDRGVQFFSVRGELLGQWKLPIEKPSEVKIPAVPGFIRPGVATETTHDFGPVPLSVILVDETHVMALATTCDNQVRVFV